MGAVDMRDTIEHTGIYRCKPGAYIPAKKAGLCYTWQYYLRRCIYDSVFSAKVGEAFWNVIDPGNFVLGACEDAGVPIACAIQAKGRELGIDVPVISIKKEPKKYGLQNWTEGLLHDRPIMLVDDLAGSQSTLLRAEALIIGRGLKLHKQYFCLVNKAGANVQPNPVYVPSAELVTLFSSDDFCLTWESYVSKYGREPVFGEYF